MVAMAIFDHYKAREIIIDKKCFISIVISGITHILLGGGVGIDWCLVVAMVSVHHTVV